MTLDVQNALVSAQYRVAQHYLQRLRQAEKGTARGLEGRVYWLDQIQQDWPQIAAWQAWSAAGIPDHPERARLCSAFAMATSNMLRVRQTLPEALHWTEQALAAARALQDSDGERELLHQMSLIYLGMEADDKVDTCAHELIELASRAEDELALGRAWCVLGTTSVFRGAYDQAERYARQSMEILEAYSAEANDMIALSWQTLGRVELYRGNYDESHAHHIRYLEMSMASDRVGAVASAHLALSGISIYRRRYDEAKYHADMCLNMAQAIGYARMIPTAILTLAHAEKWLGNLEAARQRYEEALSKRELLNPSVLINTFHGLGQTLARQGELKQALESFEEGLALSRSTRLAFRTCEILPDALAVQLQLGDGEAARASLGEVLDVAEQLGTPPFLTGAITGALLYWRSLGELEEAAVMAGVLRDYIHQLKPSIFRVDILTQLEADLGADRYAAAFVQGAQLTLKDAIARIRYQLDK